MDTPEIRFLSNHQVYYLKDYDISVKELEAQIEKIKYVSVYENYKYLKDNEVENTQFPAVAFVFYKFFFLCNRIPDTDEIISSYFFTYKTDLQDCGDTVLFENRKYNKKALVGRILRTYPSLIRDFHFNLSLVEDGSFDKVIYSYQKDIKGIDITVEHNKKEYSVSLFVATRRSLDYKVVKNNYRHNYAGKNEIQITLLLSEGKTCGDIILYTHDHINKLKNEIINYEK